MHQWLGSRKTGHPYTKGILDKNCVSRSTLQGLLKHEINHLQLVKINLPVLTFLPCSRKRGLFGHVVAKSHKAWQTMELYPTWISEVHQTYSGYMKFIWACRECLGHPISKKNEEKRSLFGWVIPIISFWHYMLIDWQQMTTIDHTYKLTDCKLTDWLRLAGLQVSGYETTNWLTKIDYKLATNWLKLTKIDIWPQVGYKLIGYKLTDWLKLTGLQVSGYETTNWLTKIDYKWLKLT